MRYETRTVPMGENVGPVDWSHPLAKDMPAIWREAEKNPNAFTFQGRHICAIAMYDGWPYWRPTPAIQFIGPLNTPEWSFFNDYYVRPSDIQPRPTHQPATEGRER